MSTPLNVTILPHDIIYADVQANLDEVERRLTNLPSATDILALPELFTAGYVKKREKLNLLAEKEDDSPTLATIRRWASEKNIAICGSYLATDGHGHFYNRGFFVEPDGTASFYDKKHLFSPSGENEIYTPGCERFRPVRFRGWNVSMFICYDLRFPAWMRNVGMDYDLVILPANWAEARSYAFRHLLIARAIENQACVVGANRSGSDPYGSYPSEMSDIFNWWGDPVGQTDKAGFITAALDREPMDEFRKRFPVYLDADDCVINP